MHRILVATDGSASATGAVRLGVGLAAAEGAQLLFVHVVPEVDVVPVTGFGIGGVFPHEPSTHDRELLEDAAALAAEHGVPARTLLLHGEAVPTLVACADARDVDLIVVGSRGRGGVASTLLGSVSRGLLRHARKPVLIAPPARAGDAVPHAVGAVGLGF